MSRSDLILTLVRAGVAGDKVLLRSTVEALAADERAKRHTVLADRLTRAIQANGQIPKSTVASAASSKAGHELVSESHPQRTLSELILREVVQKDIENVIEEHLRADLLRSHGIQPRHRILLSGPPGNGKTALAEAVAEALGLPLLTVRYEVLIGSFLGETTQRLARLFDYIRQIPSVLFFDEFDVVGKERGDVHETGEIKRVVSTLLLQVDALPSHIVVIAATNHAELLDRAVWRRFQVRLSMPAPSSKELGKFLSRAFKAMGEGNNMNANKVALELGLVSYAEATDFLIDLRRRHVLSLGQRRFADLLTEQLPLWAAKLRISSHGQRPNEADIETRSRHSRSPGAGRTNETAVPAGSYPRPAKKSARSKVHVSSARSRSRQKPS